MRDLLPCACCGSKDVKWMPEGDGSYGRVRCLQCGIQTEIGANKEERFTRWNRRSPDSEKIGIAVKALEESCQCLEKQSPDALDCPACQALALLRSDLSRVAEAREKVVEAARGTVSVRLSAIKHNVLSPQYQSGPEHDLAVALAAYDAALAAQEKQP